MKPHMSREIRHVVLGMGEVGRAVAEVLQCDGVDKGDVFPLADVLHICIPFSDTFIDTVQEVRRVTHADLTIIHSTVPVGTTRVCGENVVHSPIRGKHPDLVKSVRTFVKFFGGSRAAEAAHYFTQCGISVMCSSLPENTEAMKLWDTEIYREAILLNKRIHQYCQNYGLDFDIVYTQANRTYNEGYHLLGHPYYAKFVLEYQDGPIGGHCVEPNHKILFGVDGAS